MAVPFASLRRFLTQFSYMFINHFHVAMRQQALSSAVRRSIPQRALSSLASKPPALVPQPADAKIKLTRCVECGKQLDAPLLCGTSMCVAYCSAACQTIHWATTFRDECENFKAYAQRDVRVTLPSNPEWLEIAMDHDGTGTYSELLHRLHMNQEGSPYRLLTGEQGAPSAHRHMLNGIASKISPEPQSPPLTSWAEYYAARAISEHTPLAMLLSFPLTLYHILQLHQQSHGNDTDFVRNPIRVHYLGPEKELFILPLFRELAFLMPTSHIEVSMIGPIAFDIPEKPITYEGPHGGTITLTAHRGSYHVLAQEGSLPKGKPDVAVALNAGLGAGGYGWAPTLSLLSKRKTPFYFTDYSEYSMAHALAKAAMSGLSEPTMQTDLNPFRAPCRQPMVAGGAVGFPWLSNGFLAGFNTE